MRKLTLLLAGVIASLGLHSAAAADPPVQASQNAGQAQTPNPAVQGQVAAGPLEDRRKKLLESIMAAKRSGVGVGPYVGAFNSIEDMVKSSAPPEQIEKRLDSLSGNLQDQLKHMKDLKNRPPLAPASLGESGSPETGAAGGVNQGMLEKLKENYGDALPGALSNPLVREKLMESEMGQKLLEKLQK